MPGDLANKWITGFDKGHLAPNADFAFVSQQKATYYYLNVLPQFHKFNADGWLRVEEAVRKLAMSSGKIDIQTGTEGGLMLGDGSTTKTNVFLDDSKEIQIPWLFYKIIFVNNRSKYAFVGFNNPTHKDFGQMNRNFCVYCPHDVFTPISNAEKGIVVCCMRDNIVQERLLETYGIRAKSFDF